MTQNTRKLLGVVATLLMLVAYCVIATVIYEILLSAAHPVVLLVYFAVVGTAWCIPAMVIIRWMAKPDRT
jgi:hypothetical protein